MSKLKQDRGDKNRRGDCRDDAVRILGVIVGVIGVFHFHLLTIRYHGN